MLEIYLLLILVIFCINLIPAFMPPTWMILAFFYITFDIKLVPVVLLGAASATLGRICLALLARYYFAPVLSARGKENYKALGTFLNKNRKVSIPLIISYAFIPIPSNQVYMAVGMSHADIRLFATAFFFGRIISYSFWVAAAHKFQDSILAIFVRHFASRQTILIEIVGLLALWLVSRIPWKDLLEKEANTKIVKGLKDIIKA
jgi:membrane protein DedA with SNARE-associated domain